jgi:hypothetical protein
MQIQKKIRKYFLLLGIVLWTSGCNFVSITENIKDPSETDISERMFRHLMAESGIMKTESKVCLAFGNPLKMPASRFLNRFDDLKNKLIGLDRIQGKGLEKGYCDRKSGSSVFIYQIHRVIQPAHNRLIIEAGWYGDWKDSRKGLYEVKMENGKHHISRLSISDRCHHLITVYKQQYFSRRLAF